MTDHLKMNVVAGTEGGLIRSCMDMVRKDPRWRAHGRVERFSTRQGVRLSLRLERQIDTDERERE